LAHGIDSVGERDPFSTLSSFILSGIGEVPLRTGNVVRVPRGTNHRIFDVTEELLIYDVFAPGIV